MNDNVSHPTHYTQGPVHPACGEVVECITVTEHHNFNVGNAIKYLWRADHKADALEDLAKAAQYIQFEIDRRKYQAARNEPPLFDTYEHAHEVDLCPLNGSTIVGARIHPDPYGINPKSGHTHTSGSVFDVGQKLDDSNSHVCMDGIRVPGTYCIDRGLAALGLRFKDGVYTRLAGTHMSGRYMGPSSKAFAEALFNVGPSFKALEALFNADEPDDEGHDEPDDEAGN